MAAEIVVPTQLRLDWLKQVALSGVSHTAVHLAVVISSHINAKTGMTFLGLDTLAKELQASRRTAWTAVKELEHGHLDVRKGGGRGKASEYRMVVKTMQPVAPFDGPKRCNLASETVQSGVRNGAASCTPTQSTNSYNYSSRTKPNVMQQCLDDKLKAVREGTECIALRSYSAQWYELAAWHEANGDQRSADLMRALAESGSGMWTAPAGWQPTNKIAALRGRS
jgi:hypothetical protein